jgi:hypothetical protein
MLDNSRCPSGVLWLNMLGMVSTRFTIFPVLLLATLWSGGCATSSPQSSVGIAGGGSLNLERSGAGFKRAENDRVRISDASLQAVNFDGNYYVRWTFAILPKQASELSNIRIEDVTGSSSLALVNDVAPQRDGGIWKETAGLMEISSAGANWLADPRDTARVFKFTISEPNGQSYVLYQGVLQSRATKEAIRRMVSR